MSSTKKQDHIVSIWTDGGCRPNPGPGGWGVLLRFRDVEKEFYGGEADTTNNRMELTAAAKALEALTAPCCVHLHTDSEYVKKGITEWSKNWIRKNWKTSSGKPVVNKDLWQRLIEVTKRHDVTWHWVKGHAGIAENEHVDALATRGREALEESL